MERLAGGGIANSQGLAAGCLSGRGLAHFSHWTAASEFVWLHHGQTIDVTPWMRGRVDHVVFAENQARQDSVCPGTAASASPLDASFLMREWEASIIAEWGGRESRLL